MLNKKKKQRLSGFLMIEAIFSVFITLLIVLVLQAMVKNLTTYKKYNRPTNEISFAYVQLDRFLHEKGSQIYTVPRISNSKRSVFCKEKSGKKTFYIIKQYKDMIRLTTEVNGHMPLILNVNNCNFETNDDQIKINILEKDNRETELYFKLDKKPLDQDRKKKDDVEKKKIKS